MIIFGAGNMGRGVGTRTVAGGDDLPILDPETGKADELAEGVRDARREGRPSRAEARTIG